MGKGSYIMSEQAIAKLNDEMQKNPDTTTKRIGAYLIDIIGIDSSAAGKILVPNKSIEGSIQKMRDVAMKQVPKGFKGKNYGATLTDEEGLNIVLEYYGIELKKEHNQDNNDIFSMLDKLLD